ncbi:RNA ligase [Pelomyxa schiedti]|nr:RNA ligase [Pelomyxa schiedti]
MTTKLGEAEEEDWLEKEIVGWLTFEEYPPITLVDDYDVIDALSAHYRDAQFVVTEKIHGANFSFISDGIATTCARRKGIVPDGAKSYFDFATVKKKCEPEVRKLYQLISDLYKFGELFGGIYPHPDVPSADVSIPVQYGIYYSPTIEFCAYDIFIKGIDKKWWLDFDLCQKLFAQTELLYLKPLYTGDLQSCCAFEIEKRESVIPDMLGLPPLSGNQIEGIVIKGLHNELVPGKSFRAIFKKKNDQYAEVNAPVPLGDHTASPFHKPAPKNKARVKKKDKPAICERSSTLLPDTAPPVRDPSSLEMKTVCCTPQTASAAAVTVSSPPPEVNSMHTVVSSPFETPIEQCRNSHVDHHTKFSTSISHLPAKGSGSVKPPTKESHIPQTDSSAKKPRSAQPTNTISPTNLGSQHSTTRMLTTNNETSPTTNSGICTSTTISQGTARAAVKNFTSRAVNYNRLESATSKIGPLIPVNLKAISEEMFEDVCNEMHNMSEWSALNQKNKGQLTRSTHHTVTEFVSCSLSNNKRTSN